MPQSRAAASYGLTRREFFKGAIGTAIAAGAFGCLPAEAEQAPHAMRVINIMNFIRAVDPRGPVDLMQPVREQMKLIKAHGFPATWLLQYDALVQGPFVEFLKTQMPQDHEVGIWFEMNRRICDAAGIAWRGNPHWEWDYHVPVAYAIGYTPEERRRLADTAAATFTHIFHRQAKTVGSWNLDAVSVARFADRHGVEAFCNCRDQASTDGFTIWGAPITAYYPSRRNALSPALTGENQIGVPMFRLLGQDPVYYYDNQLKHPDTMEPAQPAGRNPVFVENFLHMLADEPAGAIAYAQLGQENSFGWPAMAEGYGMQMAKLPQWRSRGLAIETMSETGRRFRRRFAVTPMQAQVMLQDPYGNLETPERTIWHQSRYFRANLHFRGSQFYLRDLQAYSDRFPEPFLDQPTKQESIDQQLLPVLDGYHWSDASVRAGGSGLRAMGSFFLHGSEGGKAPLTISGEPSVSESVSALRAQVPLAGGGSLAVEFSEREIAMTARNLPAQQRLGLRFAWVPNLSTFQRVDGKRIEYRYRNFDYSVQIAEGAATPTENGFEIAAGHEGTLRLRMAQSA